MKHVSFTRGLFTLVFIGLLFLSVSPNLSHADTISNITIICDGGMTPGCGGLSGSVNVTQTGSNQLTFVVTNTSTTSVVDAAVLMTGFSGDFTGHTITGASGSITAGSSGVNGATAGDLSSQWGFKNSASGPFGSLVTGTTASVATLQAAVVHGTTFGGTTIGGKNSANVNGPSFGILGNDTSAGALKSYQNSLTFVLNFGSNVNGLIAQLQGGTFALAFGSPTAVPIPTTSILFGVGLAGLVAWRWREEQRSKNHLRV